MHELEIKNQLQTDFCLGCAVSSAAEAELGFPCDESYSFAMGKRYSGKPLSERGLNPKHALMGAIQYGVLPKDKSPYTIASTERDVLANPKSWQEVERFSVKPFASFKTVTNLKSSLEISPVIVGIFWQGEWDASPYIPYSKSFHRYEPHEVIATGFKNGYLVLKNSRGDDKGDKGNWYLHPRMYTVISHAYQLNKRKWYPLEKLLLNIL